jgi:hypothetical protein
LTRQELAEARSRLGYSTRRAFVEALGGISKRAVDSWEEGWSPVPKWIPVALIGLSVSQNPGKTGGFMKEAKKEKSKRDILRQRVVDLVVEFIKSEGGISQYDLQILFYNRSKKAVFAALDRMQPSPV